MEQFKIQAVIEPEQEQIFKEEKKKIETELMIYLTQGQIINKIIREWKLYKIELDNLRVKLNEYEKRKKQVA